MEDYKKIAANIFVPSFYTLLFSSSAIILTYAIIQNSIFDTFIGISLSFLTILFIIINNLSKNNIDNSDENTYKDNSVKLKIIRLKNSIVNPSSLKFILPAILISLLMPLRILSLMKSYPVNNECRSFYGIVDNVKLFRYSREVTLKFSDSAIDGAINNSHNLAISYIPRSISINPGDWIEINKKPEKIKLDKADNSSFANGLIRRGFRFIFYLNEKNFKITRRMPASFKDTIRVKIEENVSKLFNKATASTLKALYFGNKRYIDKITIHEFKRAGALHILAASGLHVAIISSIPIFLLGVFRVNKNLILLATIIFVFFYLYITDMPVSLLRAFIMFSIYSIQYFLDLEKNIINTLFLSAIIILLYYPYDLFNLGFQLSFGATLGIIIFFKFFQKAMSAFPPILQKSLSLTLSAQIPVLPIILLHMKEINLAGVISNILIVPGMSLTLILSLISNFLSLIFYQGAKFFGAITDFVFQQNLAFAKLMSGINGHFVIEDRCYILIISYFLLLIPIFPGFKNRKLLALPVIAAFISAWFYLSDSRVFKKSQIAILKKNNSNVILFINEAETIVSGNLENIAHAKKLVRYIDNNGIRNITLCILYADYKNIQNYSYIIKKTIVSECYLSSDFMFSSSLKKFCGIIDIDNIDMEIRKFKSLNHSKEYRPEVSINYMNALFKDPLTNIARIHHLISKKYTMETKRSIDDYFKKFSIIQIK